MKKFLLKDAKEIGDRLGINWNEVNVEEFTKGLNVELEHGKISSELNQQISEKGTPINFYVERL